MKKRYIIKDWAGNIKFNGKSFRTIEAASEYLQDQVLILYPETEQDDNAFYEQCDEYYIDNEN